MFRSSTFNVQRTLRISKVHQKELGDGSLLVLPTVTAMLNTTAKRVGPGPLWMMPCFAQQFDDWKIQLHSYVKFARSDGLKPPMISYWTGK